MTDENPLLPEIQKAATAKIELFENLIINLKQNYSIYNLKALQKELHHVAGNSNLYGQSEASTLCKNLELDVLSKIENFYLSKPPQNWFDNLDLFLTHLKEVFFPVKSHPKPHLHFQKRVILIVDDDEDILNLINYEFSNIGFEVLMFTNGRNTLDYLSKEKNLEAVSLFIIDRMLPDMDGLAILETLKIKGLDKPILILSALDSEKDILEGLQAQAIDYITKPFSVFMLVHKILNILKTQH